tara:strand:+ start:774 stop:1409 length:636 start_codon:yes stop_codon:yes gene_type:complete
MSEEIISEIEEDLQKERLKKYWSLYGKYISSVIILVIVIIGGWQFYNFWENKKNNDASNNFLNILSISNNDINEAINKINGLSDLPNGYKFLLKFKKASLLNKNGNNPEAQLIWKELYSDKYIDPDYKDIAIISSLMNDYDQPELITKLDDIIKNNINFSNLSKELKASILYDNGKIQESKDLFIELLNSPGINQRSRERISNILKIFRNN